jgi:hypothetical protein
MITMLYRRVRRHRRTKAQGLLEFALILPILLFVMFGMIDMGWIAFNFSQLYNGTREAARFGSVSGFGATPQYVDCNSIASKLMLQAGFSGIKSSNISIYYDDGRAPTGTVVISNSTWQAEVVGICKNGVYANNSLYQPQGAGAAQPRTQDALTNQYVRNGDRVVIVIDVQVPFLTPFFRSLWTGVLFNFTTSRSIFPNGLAA